MTHRTLYELASRFRTAIEETPLSARPINMQSFPRGACGDASLLLGAYFKDCGVEGFKYICGERGSRSEGNWSSHAWLQRENCVVDITADQFSDAPSPIVVLDPSSWHALFEIESEQESDFRLWSGYGADILRPIYSHLQNILGQKGFN